MTAETSGQEKLIAEAAEGALAPGAVSGALRPRIEELGLWRNVEELREQGATVVTDAVPLVGVPLHADHAWLPQPFPEHNCVATICLPCEGMTEAEGATRVALGSHRHRRLPSAAEAAQTKTTPLEVPKGGFAMWAGSTWHETGVRTAPGVRTVLHASCQRLYTQPVQDYTHLLRDEAYLAAAPEGIRGLVGADLFFGSESSTGIAPDPEKVAKTLLMAQQ